MSNDTGAMTPRLFLLSGMGGDRRLMRLIRVKGIEVVAPDHLDPTSDETLASYALRVSRRLGVSPLDYIGGASFGGMVAAEIAARQRVAGLVLLGSCIHPERLPWSYRWVERLGRCIPDFVLGFRSWGPLVRWRFAPIDAGAHQCLVEMARDCPSSQLRNFGRMALQWPGVKELECPVLSIHGDMDRIIPLNCAEYGVVIHDAGHAFTLTHVEQTATEIERFIERRRK